MVKRNQKGVQWYKRGAWWRRIRLNRKHKDRLFRYLFKDKKYLLDLYNALHDSDYTDPEKLEVVTMEDVIFMKMKNDLSFIIDSHLCLYEHQSSPNLNMPLRGLFYFSQQYEGLLGAKDTDVFQKKKVELPTPEYIVFYNGGDMAQDEEMLYLSDSFSMGRGSGCLECTCKVLNIKRGHNQALMEKCHRLWEYSEFISEIEANLKAGLNRGEAIQSAIDHCIKQDILADILRTEKSEVLHMIFLTEYDEKKHLQNVFEDGREEGFNAGKNAGAKMQLIQQVCKKLAKNKSLEIIAVELEEDPDLIAEICNAAGSVSDLDHNQIYKTLCGEEYYPIHHEDSPRKRKHHKA